VTTTPSPVRRPTARVVSRRRRRIAGGMLIVGAAAAVIAFWPGSDRGRERAATAPSGPESTAAARSAPAATPSQPRVGATIRNVGFRPRGVAVAGGAVWVLSIHERRITRLDPGTGRRSGAQPFVGRGAANIAGDGDTVWVAKRATSAVLRLDSRSGALVRRIATPLPPARVVAGPSGLWVVGRETKDGPATLFRYGDAGDLLDQTQFADGIEAIALGGGAAWIGLAGAQRIMRVAPGKPAEHAAWLTHPASALAWGSGHLWASVQDDNSVARIDPRTQQVVTTDVGPRPAGLAVAGGRLFVASNTTHTVAVIDPERVQRKPVSRLSVPPNPSAVTAGAGHVWVTGLGANTLTRLDY
jgi:DNA-binding beta-propeller fold protein YncE